MRLITILGAAALVALPLSASASPSFPDAIKTDLSLSYSLGTTHCTICHATNAGGVGTVVQPFGLAMRQAGLVLENTASLQSALTALESDGTDSDCDGVPDIEQLKDGRDPDPPGEYIDGSGRTHAATSCSGADGGPTTSVVIPAYGCGAHIAPAPVSSSEGAGGAALTVLALGALSLRGRRRSKKITRRSSIL